MQNKELSFTKVQIKDQLSYTIVTHKKNKVTITILILSSILIFSCTTKSEKSNQGNSRIGLVPKPDKHLRLEYEKNKDIPK